MIVTAKPLPAHDVLDSICSFLPDNMPREPVEKAVIEALAGQIIYIPLNLKWKIRNAEMISKFTGLNVCELCREYKLSRAQFYRILRKSRIKKKSLMS